METFVLFFDRPFVFIFLSVFFLVGCIISNFIELSKRLLLHRIFLIFGVLCGTLLLFLFIRLTIIEEKQAWYMFFAPIAFLLVFFFIYLVGFFVYSNWNRNLSWWFIYNSCLELFFFIKKHPNNRMRYLIRKVRDSNPGYGCPYTCTPNMRFRPLSQLSI